MSQNLRLKTIVLDPFCESMNLPWDKYEMSKLTNALSCAKMCEAGSLIMFRSDTDDDIIGKSGELCVI